MESRPDLSIIIVNRNTRDLLEACLRSIIPPPDTVTAETIVVDNASNDGSVEMVRRDFPDVQLIANDTNTGFAYPNNQGLAISAGRYVLLLNSDTMVQPHALERLVAFMDDHPGAGACGPMLRYPDGRLQPSSFNFHSPWRAFCDFSGLGTLFPRSRLFGNQQRAFDHQRTGKVEAPMGAALLVRREVVETVGGLDERFRIHSNEIDWCYRMQRAGWDRYFVAEAEVVHHLGGTLRTENEGFRLQGEMLQNLFDYHRKHYGSVGLAWFRLWLGVGFGARMLWYPIRNWIRPSAAGRRLARVAPLMVRAAWSGAPAGFSAPTEDEAFDYPPRPIAATKNGG